MTVAELFQILSRMPAGAEVRIACANEGCDVAHDIGAVDTAVAGELNIDVTGKCCIDDDVTP